jgi:hypothetical protein
VQTQVNPAPQKVEPQGELQGKPQTIPEKNTYKLTHMPQKGYKSTILKFFIGMFGVLISSLVILMSLKLYKKIGLKNKSKADNINYDKTLESPKDFKEAINLFLEKTDK